MSDAPNPLILFVHPALKRMREDRAWNGEGLRADDKLGGDPE